MSNEAKILIYRTRQRILMARGPHNAHIVAKLERKIRILQRQEVAYATSF